MNSRSTPKLRLSTAQRVAALAAAVPYVNEDADSPRSKRGDWGNAILSHSRQELRAELALRKTRAVTGVETDGAMRECDMKLPEKA